MRRFCLALCALVLVAVLSFAAGQRYEITNPSQLSLEEYECAFAQLRPDMTLAEVRYQIEQEKKQPYIAP